jgi:hypothetical protein
VHGIYKARFPHRLLTLLARDVDHMAYDLFWSRWPVGRTPTWCSRSDHVPASRKSRTVGAADQNVVI